MSLDIYIAFQYLQFKYFTTTNKNLNDGASLHRRNQLIDDVVNDLVSVSSEIELDVLERDRRISPTIKLHHGQDQDHLLA